LIQSIYKLLVTILILFVISSCATTPVAIKKVHQEMFPELIPSNVCYLRTVRTLRLIGYRTVWHSAGTLFEGQYLVTAAHNLYDSWRTKLLSAQVFCKDDNGKVVTSFVSREGLEKNRETSHYKRNYSTDYAFLKLIDPIDVSTSITLKRNIDIDSIDRIEIAGYPKSKLRYSSGVKNHSIKSDSTTFYYNIDTAKGMSGGPVWIRSGDIITL
jgi:V8-like Glu-specific endopeptidase